MEVKLEHIEKTKSVLQKGKRPGAASASVASSCGQQAWSGGQQVRPAVWSGSHRLVGLRLESHGLMRATICKQGATGTNKAIGKKKASGKNKTIGKKKTSGKNNSGGQWPAVAAIMDSSRGHNLIVRLCS